MDLWHVKKIIDFLGWNQNSGQLNLAGEHFFLDIECFFKNKMKMFLENLPINVI